ncbi:hypothetical protein CR983_01535 [Candidatus Saccharibacteria bacterium]|nr:MAG: hypothetical protein CR983_01535 [Candidatus Saccharibacteria bacterium]
MIHLGQRADLKVLLDKLDAAASGCGAKSFYKDELWDRYDLANLNRRRTDGGAEPLDGEVRCHDLTICNQHHEQGLVAGENDLDEMVAQRRKLEQGNVLLNVVDWICIEAMRRECGEPSLDTHTVTRFVQMDDRIVGSRGSTIGSAHSFDTGAQVVALDESFGGVRRSDAGVRRSVGVRPGYTFAAAGNGTALRSDRAS